MKRSYSQTVKAVRERDSRSRKGSERRFNVPLRKFIEHKYPTIYNEYVELFNLMVSAHPNRRNLATSSTFREWMTANPANETQGKQTATSSALVIPQYPCADIISQALQGAFAEETPGQNNDQNPCQDIEQLPPPTEQDPTENNEHLNEVDDILNEIMINEDVRNILEQPDPTVDEGIELNILDEIEFDIEPFDFDLEVEAYGF